MKDTIQKGRWKRVLALCAVLALAACCLWSTLSASAAETAGAAAQTQQESTAAPTAPGASARRVVRVGFFNMDGYHVEDADGLKSGYGYDFLQKLCRYNNWTLEYVGYDRSWGDMLTMLENGEIDLVTSAQKTPERIDKFSFSAEAIGTSATIFTVRAGDSRYVIGSPSSYDGVRVGMLEGNSRNKSFEAFAARSGFSYSPVYFDSTDALVSALHEEKSIDAAVTSNLRSLQEETILEEFDASGFYVMTRKTDFSLLAQLNAGIAQMDSDTPSWRTELSDKYYAAAVGDAISFNTGEVAYLERLSREGAVLRVASNPDLAPYSYVEDGELKGIAPTLFAEIAERVGLRYTFVPMDSYADYNALIAGGGAEIDLTCFFNYSLAEYYGVSLTDPYLVTTMAKLTRAGTNGNIKTAAMLHASELQTSYGSSLLSGVTCREYPTVEACAKAVLSGEADGVFLYAYTAQKTANDDARNRLTVTLLPEYSVNLAIGVNRDEDYHLVTILNKGVKSVKNSYVQRVVAEQTAFLSENDSLLAQFYDNPGLAMAAGALILTLVFLAALLAVRVNALHRRNVQAQELSRFMGYVCESNETVMEVDLNTLRCRRHTMQDGVLVSREEPYRFTNFFNSETVLSAEDFTRITGEITRDTLTEMIRAGGGTYFEARAKGQDGVQRWYSYTLRAIPCDRAHPNSFILFKKNIDEAKREDERRHRALEDALTAARSASEAKGQFLSRMSHEIRTPLNAVIGYMDIARSSAENSVKVMHCIENSDLAARHLLSIINDVLDISSIESGRMKIAAEEFDLKKQLTTVSTIFYNQAGEKGITFETVLHGLTEEWVVGDSLRVNQILMNLLSNAVKFTPAGGTITLGVTQMRVQDGKVYLKFEVRDTGIGMSEAYQKKLFTPFEQENASTARKYGGTGLGLSITYNLVQMMGGSIEVQSRQNEGTAFTVLLHFGHAENHAGKNVLPPDYSRLRALVVDDEKDSCEYIKSLLKRCGVKSDTVCSGEDAVRQLRRRLGTDYQYDLCILDWHMPGMDGMETAKRLHAECAEGLPIIIATAYDPTALLDEAKKCGVTRVVAKPLFQSTLFDLLVSTYGKYAPAAPQTQTSLDLKGAHVLLAEDNAMNQEIAVEVLTRAGLRVDTAENGQIAYDKFAASPAGTYQAILMDIQMPVLDGYAATVKIRASAHPEAKTMPIIAMTANAFAEDVAAALASGMNDHVSKPIDYDKLFRALSRLVKPDETEKETAARR